MSSSLTTNSIDEGKLILHIAENGHSFELKCDENTLVDAIMHYVESVSGISISDQLVFCLGTKLEPQRPLSAYKLPCNERELFIFNKVRLQSNTPSPPPEHVDILEVTLPPLPSPSRDPHPLDDASDPALKALPSYERQFRYHYHCGHAIYRASQLRYECCQRLLGEQKVQERAVDIARNNLEQYYRVINQNYVEFSKRYLQQHRIHSDLLANFGRDIEKLRSTQLHPMLQTTTHKCLSDFVKEENLRKAVENCSNSHKQFEVKVSQFKQMFAEVKRKVEDLLSSKASLPVRNLELMIKEHQRNITEQKSIMQSLSKDVDKVKQLVDDCLSGQLSSSLRPHDAVSALGPMYDVHDKNHLPKMQSCDRSMCKLLEFCKDKKNEMNIFVHSYMQRITYVSYIIKDIKLQFPVFKEAMTCQDDLFADLKLVRGICPAYKACLAEIVRRKASMKLYMGMAGELAEKFAMKRQIEVRRREEFLRAQSLFIPRAVLASMGLFDTPSQCEVHISPFDGGLLNIDISDLDQNTSEYLTGLQSKGENHGSLEGSVSLSNNSSNSLEAGKRSAQSLENTDELLEGCETIDIAGTDRMEVENAKLKAEYASAIAVICSLSPLVEYEFLDDSKMESILKDTAEKTAEALRLKDKHEKHLHEMLKMKQLQCESYERRITELEQKLSVAYFQEHRLSSSNNDADISISSTNVLECKQEPSCGDEAQMPCISSAEPMDEVSSVSNPLDPDYGDVIGQLNKHRGLDEKLAELSRLLRPTLDSPMSEPHHSVLQEDDKDGNNKIGQPSALVINSVADESSKEAVVSHGDRGLDTALDINVSNNLVLELQSALSEKSNQLSDTEIKLKSSLDEVVMLRRELDMSRKLLDESQMNCAHLENCLHEAREEAQTHLCAADRKASEYRVLRASAVKMRALFERLRACVYSPGNVAAFADSLRALAQSLNNSMSENEDDGTAEFQKCIQLLADRVGFLFQHREQLLDKYSKIEAANEQLRKELEEKKELLKTLYAKHQLEKLANKEKISYSHLKVHELAAFVLNSRGHYEAINRNCSHYYLSAESVALFADHLPSRPIYIVGQIVHVERRKVPFASHSDNNKVGQRYQLTSELESNQCSLNSGSTLNPFGLPAGCEFFVVTVAMLPTAIHSPPASGSLLLEGRPT